MTPRRVPLHKAVEDAIAARLGIASVTSNEAAWAALEVIEACTDNGGYRRAVPLVHDALRPFSGPGGSIDGARVREAARAVADAVEASGVINRLPTAR